MDNKEHCIKKKKKKDKDTNADAHLPLIKNAPLQGSQKILSPESYPSIDRKKLDERFYFQSLVDTAFLLGDLDEETLNRFQRDLALLLAFKADQFTRGESSSVRVEIAEMLMHSNLFTLGHYLKSLDSPDDALKCIKTKPLREVYDMGLSHLYASIEYAKKLHKAILKTPFITSNETYNETIVAGIKGFFKLYDPSFEAHNIHITADYPTIIPTANLEGIEFIVAYLRAIYHENKFCNLFSPSEIHLYLKGLHAQYELLIFNLFEPILTGAIACHLLGLEETALSLTPFHREQLYTTLYGLTSQELSHKIKHTVRSLCDKLGLSKMSSRKYVWRAIPVIVSRLALSLKSDTLEQVIYIKTKPKKDQPLFYHARPKMDDALFREVLTELSQCRYASDRIALLLREVKTIDDFEDIVTEGILTQKEINTFLSRLPLTELAVLISRHPLTPSISITERTAQDILLSQCLEEIRRKLPEDRQHALENISQHL